jgi:hypothetical protein
MDIDKVKVEVAQVGALLVQIDMTGIIIARLRKEMEDVQANIARDCKNIRKHRAALSALGVNRIIYFVARDLQKKVTKFIFLSVALDLLNKLVAEQEAQIEAHNASVRKKQKTKE